VPSDADKFGDEVDRDLIHTQTYVTESGARRRVEFERDADTGRAVRRELRRVDGEWVTLGSETLRSLEINGEVRSAVDLRAALTE
jgi:hypothetical protein